MKKPKKKTLIGKTVQQIITEKLHSKSINQYQYDILVYLFPEERKELFQHLIIGKKISRKKAIEISNEILLNAEKERRECLR